MTTENGVPSRREARHHIERLRERQEWLISKAVALGVCSDYERAEIEALEWALPILETEFMQLARMRLNMQRVDQQTAAYERLDRVGTTHQKTITWQTATGDEGTD